MPAYLLDCNHLSAAIRVRSPLRVEIQSKRLQGVRFVTCIPILCELEVGIRQTAKPDEYRQRLVQLRRHFRIWPLDLDTSSHYGELYRELHEKGRILSQVDIMLASLARQHDLTIFTSDRDFEALPDLRVENWIA